MAEHSDATTGGMRIPTGVRGMVADWSSDKTTFNVSWGKLMMWIFLLGDTFIFGSFLVGYMTVRLSTTEIWPNQGEVFALHVGDTAVPLLLIAIMTFVLISSSGTMAMAVNFAYRKNKNVTFALMFVTCIFGLMFVGMQAFEWTKLIEEGVRPWENPWGAPQFGSIFFMVTGFHGLHVSLGVIYLLIVAFRVRSGRYEKSGNYQIVEIAGLYWHFVDLVWVFIFAFFYLW
jgi:cytochrome c oxidase subunit 3